jgi:ABC-type multidrug transport system, ATPase component
VTLVLTTHYMDEAEQLCDRLVVMDNGKIAEEGSPVELIQRFSSREVVELRFAHDVPKVDEHVFNGQVSRIEVLPDRLLLYTDDGDALVPVAHELLHPQSVLVRRSTLEDVFLRLTGRTLVD